MTEIQYNVLIEREGKGIQVDWGNEPGWMERYRDHLDTADRITLVPKPGVPMPVVSTRLGDGKRWILMSRVRGILNQGTGQESEIRLYFLGWQKTVGGENVKSITWIYPNGMTENAEEPSFAHHFLPQPQ